ncbi:alpha-galactosidase [Promicromonospora sp. Populi]|uniref:alpha-galactosidase n=1 Tax=Promicromonospora sp. Populi TaxID=3239420 RepID=UPI0034E2B89C
MTAPVGLPTLPWVPGIEYGTITSVVELPGAPDGAVAVLASAAPRAADVQATVTTSPSGKVVVHISAPVPVETSFVALVPTRDAVALWTPGSGTDRGGLTPSWAGEHVVSPFEGIPLGCVIGRSDTAELTFGVRTDLDSVRLRAGLVEETAQVQVACDLIADEHGTDVVLDFERQPFTQAVRAVGAEIGLHVDAPLDASLDASAEASGARHEEPVLCTWYALHQHVDTASLTAEGRLGAELGFGTMIVDDGWQTADNGRGYGSCGDWAVEPTKIPDPAALVSELRELGLETMWWIGSPFVGLRSAAYAATSGLPLPVLYEDKGLDASVLDPRSRRVREHLRERLLALMRTTGAAGLKIDFLERWGRTPETPAPADAVSGSVPDAALSLLDELIAGIKETVPDPLVEFREPYTGARAIRRATMLRVGDCPMSPRRNRMGITDLRLVTAGIAVHADPVMWAPHDSPERVAQHLHNTMFGVPQVSVLLDGLRADHRAVLAHWLDTWHRVRDVVLHGTLTVSGVSDGYNEVTATGSRTADGEAVTVQYTPVVSSPPAGATSWLLVNAHDEDAVLVRTAPDVVADVEVVDCQGRQLSSSRVTLGEITRLPVPPGGTARITLEAS